MINKLVSGIDQQERAELVAEAIAQAAFGESEPASKAKGNDSEDSEVDESKQSKKSNRLKSRLEMIESSCLYQIKVPDDIEIKTYGKLYQYLSTQGIIPLGLLRGTYGKMAIGPKNNKMPYVYTNPDKYAELFTCDRIFVLSTKPLQMNQRVDIKVSS